MMNRIAEILKCADIREWGVADFKSVENSLLECRAKNRIPEGAQSIIMAAFPYKVEKAPPKNISRYAAVPDYHEVCGKMLKKATELLALEFKNYQFEWFLDNSPIPEVATANVCGLGCLGKNGLLIHKKYGSYVFLGEIITDLKLETHQTHEKCLDCGRCAQVCDTITSKENCLSVVNQQKKALNDAQIQRIKESGSCWGCDKCAEVCPMNENSEKTYIKEFLDGYRNQFALSENREGRAYNWRGKEIIERNYKIINNSN